MNNFLITFIVFDAHRIYFTCSTNCFLIFLFEVFNDLPRVFKKSEQLPIDQSAIVKKRPLTNQKTICSFRSLLLPLLFNLRNLERAKKQQKRKREHMEKKTQHK